MEFTTTLPKVPESSAPLPPPAVPASVYTKEYYSNCCAGHEEWMKSGGAEAAGVYEACLQMSGFPAGGVLVDIGTGRGELLAVAVEHGAAHAIGVEYSSDAVVMARTTLAMRNVEDRAEVLQADARRIPVEDGVADLVTLLDVVEHLTVTELRAALREAHRLLRPGGVVFVHTMPNRVIYEQTYRWLRKAWPGGRRWPKDPRNDHERLMHVNEQTTGSLHVALVSAGFVDPLVTLGSWVYADFVPSHRAQRVYRVLAGWRRTRHLGVANIFASASRSG